MIIVVCDSRELASGVPDRLAVAGVQVEVRPLLAGDYLISAAFAVERKTAKDFVNSLLNGRLLAQLEALAATCEYAVLLVEGELHLGQRLKMPMLARFYHWVSMRPNLTLLWTNNSGQTASLLRLLATEEQSARAIAAATVARVQVATAREPLDVLRALPAVGPVAAAKLLDRFGCVSAAMSASEADLQSVLGAKRGRVVYDLVRTQR